MLKKTIFAFIFWAFCFSFEVNAADQDIGAEVDFVSVLSLNNSIDIDYGLIQYTGANANDVAISSATGSISCSDTTNYTCPSSGTRGSVEISATTGYTVDISCETGGVIGNGVDSLDLTNAEFNIDGSTSSCNGLGTAPRPHVVAGVVSSDTVYFGAKIVIPDTGIQSTGGYSTGNGTPLSVRVVYQ